jgi:hypothetical protein
MARFGLVGGSYQSQSLNADCQRSLNWYPEKIESGAGKSSFVLYPVPGVDAFASFIIGGAQPNGPNWGHTIVNGRVFAVVDSSFYEVFSDGSVTRYGAVTNPGGIVSFAVSNQYILVAAGGDLFTFKLGSNTFAAVSSIGIVNCVGYLDGFFIAVIANSNQYNISALEDPTTWDPADFETITRFIGNIQTLVVDHGEAWFFGERQTIPYYDSGATDFPFLPVSAGSIQQGISAPQSKVQMDNTIFWLGGDDHGQGIAWRANGYQPVRVSDHACEFQWSKYATIADAIGYTYQDQGHTFWCLYFPTAQATWVYDVATGLWHERAWSTVPSATDSGVSIFYQCHVFAFGKHLFGTANTNANGDGTSSKIDYLLNPSALNQAPYQRTLTPRERVSPHISIENQRLFHSELIIDLEAGLGSEDHSYTDGQGHHPVFEPVKVMLDWSDDGGHTFSNIYNLPAGMLGQYKARCRMTRLGYSRDRVYRIRCSDAIPWRIIDAYVIAAPYGREESTSSRVRRSA